MRLTHMLEGNKLYSKSTDLIVSLIQKTPHRNIQNNVSTNTWAPWAAKSTHKINYHRWIKDIFKNQIRFSTMQQVNPNDDLLLLAV